MTMRLIAVDDTGHLGALVRSVQVVRSSFQLVAEARNRVDAVALASMCGPDVVLIADDLPDLLDHDLIGELRRAAPTSEIIVVSAGNSERAMVGSDVGSPRTADEVSGLINALDAATSTRPSATLDIDMDPTSVRRARQFVGERCNRWRCDPSIIETAQLVVSELVTNAIVHAKTPSVVGVRLDADVLRLEVTDYEQAAPNPRRPTPIEDGGRGLLFVASLAAAWGVEPLDIGKVVWAELALDLLR